MTNYKQLILDSINEEITGTTIERLVMVKTIFEDEMALPNKNMSRKSIDKLLEYWLRGLCSTVQIPYMDFDIIEWLEHESGRIVTDEEESEQVDSYWTSCAKTLHEMLYK
jgi:hypothetical protein